MSVVFLCRESIPAIFVAHALSRDARLDAIVVEQGRAARRRKLRRMREATPVWMLPIMLLDILSLVLYSRWTSRYLRSQLLEPRGLAGYPADVPVDRFDDANDTACVARLKELEPDVLIVLGTSILREPLLSLPRRHLLNIHGGIVPHYRNVHSDFWALLHRDFEHLGTSILHLDAGIDSGDIALQEVIEWEPGDHLLSIKKKNLELAARLAVEAVRLAAEGKLDRKKQSATDAGFYRMPGFWDVLRLLAQSSSRETDDPKATIRANSVARPAEGEN